MRAATGSMRDDGIWLPGKGRPVSGSRMADANCPVRSAAEGSVETVVLLRRRIPFSTSPKKNVRLRMSGNPTAPPNWLRLYGGFSVAKKLRASSASCRKYSYTAPCSVFVPDLSDTLTTPDDDRPYSAE